MSHICRTCLLIITDETKYVNLSDNTPASLEIRYKLSYSLPEMNIQLVSETLLCSSCLDILDFIFKFKKQCLLIEQGIYRYIHNNKGRENVTEKSYKLNEVYTSNSIPQEEIKNDNIDVSPDINFIRTIQATTSSEEEEVIVTPQIESIVGSYKEEEEEKTVLNGDLNTCTICPFKTHNYLQLKKHMKVHGIKMHFECKYCKYQTFNKHNFITHARVHTGEKPFLCNICKAKFALKSTLIQHRNIHTKEKVYFCTFCTFQTVHRRALGDHMMRHSGEKPFACTQCVFRTARKRYLRMHIDKRHNNNTAND